jgi:site-specific DNA-methyltransferase (adenine-specific)
MNITTITTKQPWAKLGPRGYCRDLGTVGIGLPTPPVDIPRRTVLLGDALTQLKELPGSSIDCCVTSPPYYALRDYFVPGQIGLEPSVDDWVGDLTAVMVEVGRVLKPAGSLWLNLGDSFSRHSKFGAPAKSLLAAPERLLLALMDNGWILRSKVIWSKPNPLPNSVADRLNLTYEVVYFLVRSPRYFFDLDAIREPHRSSAGRRDTSGSTTSPDWAGPLADGSQDGLRRFRPAGQPGHPLGKNPGSVWEIPTYGFRGPHFATFPPELVRRPVLATCPEAVCTRCGRPWRRSVSLTRIPVGPSSERPKPLDKQVMRFKDRWHTVRKVGDLVPCSCQAPTVSGVVLDPFMGAGTVGLVAEQLDRDWLGIEISSEYRQLAMSRIEKARSVP